MWGTTNSKPPGPIIIRFGHRSKRGSKQQVSQVLFITLFATRCTALLRLLRGKLMCFDFPSSDFNVQGHIGTEE
jgi:hypothetical protein